MQFIRVENLVRHIPGFDVMRLLGASSSRKDETLIAELGYRPTVGEVYGF